MTWHQWHQTAERERRMGLSWACASWNAWGPQWRQWISWARLGRGEKWKRACSSVMMARPLPGLRFDFGDELGDEVEAAEGGDDVDAGALVAAEGEEVAGRGLAFPGAALIAGAAHALADGGGEAHAGGPGGGEVRGG